jgi:LysR family transcriptional regulator for bpeEF and oprC
MNGDVMDLKALSIFVRVSELRSFVRAAKDLGMTQSGVSNAISRLEDQFGVVLLARTTRNVNLTEDGAAFFERCRQILADLKEAELVLTSARLQPVGRLRISVPGSFGRLKIVPILGAFQAEYPGVQVHVSITDRYIDLVEEGIDIAVRFGELEKSGLMARHLMRVQRRLVGTPAYFAQFGRPRTPEDLLNHNCLALTHYETQRARDWHFQSNGADQIITPKGSMSFNDGTALWSAVLAGYGLGQIHNYYIDDAIANGTLEAVLENLGPPKDLVSLVYAPARHLTPKVRAFVDFMISRFR